MASPLMTQREHDREYGDLKYLARIKELSSDEVGLVKGFHVRKLQLVLAKSGVFHLSLKKSLVRYNNRLSELRLLLKKPSKQDAMDKFNELRKEAKHIKKHLELSRKIIREYYNTINTLLEKEEALDSLMSSHFPAFFDEAEEKERKAKVEAMTARVRKDLTHIRYLLVELDKLFSAELKDLISMVQEQVRQTHENIFNFARVNQLFEQMQNRFEKIMQKAGRLKKEVGESEGEMEDRYHIIQMVVEGKG